MRRRSLAILPLRPTCLSLAALLLAGPAALAPGSPAIAGGKPAPDRASLRGVEDRGDHRALRRAVEEALPHVVRRARAPRATAAARRAARSLELLRDALARPEPAFSEALAARFTAGPERPVFVTGYHEPLLRARRRPDRRFRHALYRLPPRGAARGGRLPTRAEIDAGALDGMGLEIFWTDDPVELFFLHVQGSGRLELDDGSVVRIAYAGNNGHRYRSIGKVLVERGVFRPEEATAPAIKRHLREHPDEMRAILQQNPRYVFFAEGGEETPSALAGRVRSGPTGALGAPLVPYRSVAVDPNTVALGSIGFLRVPLPGGGRLESLVVAMDTGAAITGAGRIDLFCGPGAEAERVAGELRHHGRIVWLEPRDGTQPPRRPPSETSESR